LTGWLAGRRVVLGVSGGIAAYKAIEVCRRLVDAGAHVAPILTEDALRFVGRTTFSALASEPARTSLFDDPLGDPIPHTRLGQSADVIVVAPATARVIGSYAHGISGDLLVATLLATRAPVVVCPAMHTEMWEHPAVRDNLALLRSRGVQVVDPGVGRLAGGDSGAGRLAEPDDIVFAIEAALAPQDLAGRRLVITAGGTREPLDPVRYLGNRSSGRQGYALAHEAAVRGADVTLVSTVDRWAPSTVTVTPVQTAAEMEAATVAAAADAHAVIMAAAVADFRPKAVAPSKIKKAEGLPELVLEPTPDILAALGERKPAGQVLVGFAAETSAVREEALAKLRRKRLDLIVANDVTAPGAGFEHETNQVNVLGADGSEQNVPLTGKREVARIVLDAVVERLGE
jgi:phosphopantothenoylcysteine decarboxylase/phosphopantothenate--cysteine ligase